MTRGQRVGYAVTFAASFGLAMTAGWLGVQVDNAAYDWMFVHQPPPPGQPESRLLTVDERSLSKLGGIWRLRGMLAEGLERLAVARPRVVAVDLILADSSRYPQEDAALERALGKLPNLVLASELVGRPSAWEDPLAAFKRRAAAVGHVHADTGPLDGVCRMVPLEKIAGRQRRWALALEAYRLSRGVDQVVSSPGDLDVGGAIVPARWSDSRELRVHYRTGAIPQISLWQLHQDPGLAEQFRGRVVFVGVTAQSVASADRLLTPYSNSEMVPGVEIHASVFETLTHGEFLRSASNLSVAGFCLMLAAAGVAAFAFRTGWQAYTMAVLVILAGHLLPWVLFRNHIVFPYFAPVSAAWLAVVGAGSFQFVVVRRQLKDSEAETVRYQQAMHFVTHEMRTPLTAIQGSSELMSRYNLSEEKRKQIAELINSESKRLAKMIETFLSVERLSAGQMELKQEVFSARDVIEACLERARPVAERKQIRIHAEPAASASLTGDRELMEYAVYNLLTNAVKYSPAQTQITVRVEADGERLRISVQDQGIGMEQHELKKIFQKFYRTRGALASGEKGTGIGLSIVEQIVAHHGGRIEVASAPGRGSCFTLVLPAHISEWAAGMKS